MALNVLDEDEDGFMLMVEGVCRLDWSPEPDPARPEETVDFFALSGAAPSYERWSRPTQLGRDLICRLPETTR
ncbi:MAG: hypothetical protein R2722_17705 [Tessaracoccus sp.]